MDDIDSIFNFIIEIEKLKNIYRKTKPVGLDRYENSAEHSWHVCLTALMFKDYDNEPIDINHVIKMLLIHDLGEIDAGDTIIYSGETAAIKAQEAAGVARVFGLLPDEQAQYFLMLWQEFELGETAEAKFARAVDRIPPLLHNLHGDGHSWRDNNVAAEKVFSVNSRIALGSEQLLEAIKTKLTDAVSTGLLK